MTTPDAIRVSAFALGGTPTRPHTPLPAESRAIPGRPGSSPNV